MFVAFSFILCYYFIIGSSALESGASIVNRNNNNNNNNDNDNDNDDDDDGDND